MSNENNSRVLSKFNLQNKLPKFTLDDNCVSFTIIINSKSRNFSLLGGLIGKLNFE